MSKIDKVPVGTVVNSGLYAFKKRWQALMPELDAKARILHAELMQTGMDDITLEDWLEGFLFDMHPDRELAIWEYIITRFREKTVGRGRTAQKRIWREVMVKAAIFELDDKSQN